MLSNKTLRHQKAQLKSAVLMRLKGGLFELAHNWVENLRGKEGQIAWLFIGDYFLDLFSEFGNIKLRVKSELESVLVDPENRPGTEVYYLIWLASQGVVDGQHSLVEQMSSRNGVYCPPLRKESVERLIKKLCENEQLVVLAGPPLIAAHSDL